PRHEGTRHNAGFWFVEALARRAGVALREEPRFRARLARAEVHGRDLRLLEPLTYMNHSGEAVAAVARFYRYPLEAILVVHDDLDLPPGAVRLKRGGGHGGHNGLRDIIARLGSRDFLRLRLGIGHPGPGADVVGYVLSRPPAAERAAIEAAIEAALEALPDILSGEPRRLDRAMSRLHRLPDGQGA
ncbi:MAG TPA: aminoacyl-tRNA hydrolase, partial [Chromatiales bacterium]|nr:aminoacyl-tRNA hydrolase [Chromatiales bacterium]